MLRNQALVALAGGEDMECDPHADFALLSGEREEPPPPPQDPEERMRIIAALAR